MESPTSVYLYEILAILALYGDIAVNLISS